MATAITNERMNIAHFEARQNLHTLRLDRKKFGIFFFYFESA